MERSPAAPCAHPLRSTVGTEHDCIYICWRGGRAGAGRRGVRRGAVQPCGREQAGAAPGSRPRLCRGWAAACWGWAAVCPAGWPRAGRRPCTAHRRQGRHPPFVGAACRRGGSACRCAGSVGCTRCLGRQVSIPSLPRSRTQHPGTGAWRDCERRARRWASCRCAPRSRRSAASTSCTASWCAPAGLPGGWGAELHSAPHTPRAGGPRLSCSRSWTS